WTVEAEPRCVEITASAASALGAWPVTAAMKMSRSSAQSSVSMRAVTVAVRGTARRSAISPKWARARKVNAGRPFGSSVPSPRPHRPDPDRREEDALEDAEDPRPDLVRRRALQQRQACHVDQDVADADDPEAEERQGDAGPEPEDDERHSPHQHPEPEHAGEP